MCMDETNQLNSGGEHTVNKTQLVEVLSSVIYIGKVNEVNHKEIRLVIENMFKEAGMKNKKVR